MREREMAVADVAGAGGGAILLNTSDLSVGYGGESLIDGIDLEFREGEIVSLIGPNGAGKSTILKTLSGHLAPVAGSIRVCGEDLHKMDGGDLARTVAVMFTHHVHTELMTCRDVVEAGRYPYTGRMGTLDAHDKGEVRAAMELADVWDLRERDFMRISDGQRQRVLLARAICQEPRILMLDEPSNYLDIHYQIELLCILRHLVRTRSVAVIMAMHELDFARRVSDYVVCVRGRRIFARGTAGEIFTEGVMDRLYDLAPKTYDPRTGAIDLDAALTRYDGGRALDDGRALGAATWDSMQRASEGGVR